MNSIRIQISILTYMSAIRNKYFRDAMLDASSKKI
jgi:hypothetical protein